MTRLLPAVAASILLACFAALATEPEFVEIDPVSRKPVGTPVQFIEGTWIVRPRMEGPIVPPTPTPEPTPKTLLESGYPFVPQRVDYAIEMGVWQARDPSLWIGGLMGAHTGKCILADSQTCQQYIDLIGAAAVREGETYGLFLFSPRWQYVNFPNRTSPFFRIFGGAAAVNVSAERAWKPAGGVGVGVTTYFHKNVDLRAEARVGGVDQSFALGLLSVHVKTDRLLEYFAVKLKDLGVGTFKTAIEAGSAVFEATGEGVGSAIDEMRSKKPTVTPTPKPKK